MAIEIKMPALSPTMEEGTLAKWLVKAGDTVKSGDILAEIETDKATMEFEAVDEGVIASIAVAEGTDGVKVGTVIATISEEGESAALAPKAEAAAPPAQGAEPVARSEEQAEDHGLPPNPGEKASAMPDAGRERVKASPLARRIAAQKGVELSSLSGSGPNGRIVRADVEGLQSGDGRAPITPQLETGPRPSSGKEEVANVASVAASKPVAIPEIPHAATKLSNVRKTIARRLTEAKQTVPHIYLTVDVQLDALLALRAELNDALEARGVKLSVNDLLVKALAASLMQVPKCNVMFTPDQLIAFKRADISVAVSTPAGLITPIVSEADTKPVSVIATEIKELAGRAREGKLKPEEYQGGTASISNMGMYGIKQFDAVINPPQGMILAVGAGEKRPWVMPDGTLGVATIMSATGSFDHRAIDGADGAELMQAFKGLVEKPLGLLA
ncbi:pyruvate dehydrogenase complex dihydrolipoamide acetyltransferase [Sphingomonas sp.]|jgi:pyruvate dehydrogenase E2 component (dihydrolipoamide acetyltransferase)|uniref:pyruvate dehydrogenase complex dihydrolipoamide acetyltransferase n=1 Tax=Sphingomonas sp. TaxID=28214 RepID=UPI002D7E5E24|nr:pyruvate dehydrogenase complex dihydrolipoamide acetyltransferase [Sphingomonas sp.]HEU0044288.1 pyruvate dehydrogenase complex dihydrolipoamide acetyltransferase [Sphingomonas sp.]